MDTIFAADALEQSFCPAIKSNTCDDKIYENIQMAKALRVKALCAQPAKEGAVAIVGGGPSLKQTWEQLRDFKGKIVALNGAHHFLIERGIVPWACVLMDAQPSTIEFIKPSHAKVKYFVASQVDTPVINALLRSKRYLRLFHLNTPEWEAQAQVMEDAVNSAGTVASAALCVLHMIGFRTFHLFGVDSCITDSHHAYEQKQNDKDAIFTVEFEGKKYRCTDWMAVQFHGFMKLVRTHGMDVTVHGESLLKHGLDSLRKGKKDD